MKILIVIVTVTDFSLESLNTIVCLWFFSQSTDYQNPSVEL